MAQMSTKLGLTLAFLAAVLSGTTEAKKPESIEKIVRLMQLHNLRQYAYPGQFPSSNDHSSSPSQKGGSTTPQSTTTAVQVARRCYYCYGTPDVCERSNIQYYCNENERYCKLDVNTIAYPYVKQQCHSSCVENVKSDGTGYTYCTRVDLGNCYRQQCNRISGGERISASSSTVLLLATTLAMAAAARALL